MGCLNWLPLTVLSCMSFFCGHLGHAVVEHVLLVQLALLGHHGQRPSGRAGAHAHAAAHAVQRADGHGELVHALALAGLDVHDLGGRQAQSAASSSVRAKGRMVACGQTVGALVALDALCGIPRRERRRPRRASHRRRRPARTVPSTWSTKAETGRLSPSILPTGSRISLTILTSSGVALELLGLLGVDGVGPVGGHVDLLIGGGAQVDGLVVHVNDVLALLQVGAWWPSSFM